MNIFYFFIVMFFVYIPTHTSPVYASLKAPVSWYGVVDKKDLIVGGCLATATFVATSFVKDPYLRKSLAYLSVACLFTRLLTTTPLIKSFFNRVPVIKEVLGCTNKGCEGICQECILKHHYIEGAVVATASTALMQAAHAHKKSGVQQSKNNTPAKQEQVVEQECPLCTETKKLFKFECCKEKQAVCVDCVINVYKAAEENRQEPMCPYCRAPFMNVYLAIIEKANIQLDDNGMKLNDIDAPIDTHYKKNVVKKTSWEQLVTYLTRRMGTPFLAGLGLALWVEHRPWVKDFLSATSLSTALLIGSTYTHGTTKDYLSALAVYAPLLGIMQKYIFTKKLLKHIPLINQFLVCENPDCVHVCGRCKLRTMYTALFATTVLGSLYE